MHVFPPDWKPDYFESFIAGYTIGITYATRGEEPEDSDALHWQMWTGSTGNTMAFTRGKVLARTQMALRALIEKRQDKRREAAAS